MLIRIDLFRNASKLDFIIMDVPQKTIEGVADEISTNGIIVGKQCHTENRDGAYRVRYSKPAALTEFGVITEWGPS